MPSPTGPPPDLDRLRVHDPAPLAAHFEIDRAAHIYALVDLEEPFWSASAWYRRGQAVVGLVALPGEPGRTAYAVSTTDPAGTLALLVDLLPELRPGELVTGPVGLVEAVGAAHPLAWGGPHLRYQLIGPPPTDQGAGLAAPYRLDPLDEADELELTALYRTEPGAAFFSPGMLGDRTFVGVRAQGELVAAAGTHVCSEQAGVAAIGAVYTRPDHRGHGLGRAVTAGVIERLAGRVATIGLNVAEGNQPARRIYEALGFEPILAYEEVELASTA